MRLALVALVAGAGCAQIAGIDDTTGPEITTEDASVQIQRVTIGATVVKAPEDLSGESATFYDDTVQTLAPVPGVLEGTDTFTGDAPGTPSVLVTLPEAFTVATRRLYALPARDQKASFNVLAHPGAQPPPANAALDLNITLPSAYVSGETFTVEAIGAWADSPVNEVPAVDTGVTTLDPSPIAYASFTSMVNRDLIAITQADVVLVLRYVGTQLTGVFQTQFDQTDAADPVAGTMTAVPPTSSLTATLTPPAYQTRFGSVRPAVGGQSISWRLTASPGHTVADSNGVRLAAGSVDPSADTALTAMYGNPFESLDWPAVFVVATTASRSYTYSENAMSANVGLSASMSSVAVASDSLDITMPAGLAITVTANGTALVTDGQALALDTTQPVTLDATFDKTANTAYGLTVIELGIDASSGSPVVTKTHVVDAFTAGTTKFRLPGATFTAGKSYYLQYRSYVGGLAGAPAGDLTTVTLPYSTSTFDSAVFTVGML